MKNAQFNIKLINSISLKLLSTINKNQSDALTKTKKINVKQTMKFWMENVPQWKRILYEYAESIFYYYAWIHRIYSQEEKKI